MAKLTVPVIGNVIHAYSKPYDPFEGADGSMVPAGIGTWVWLDRGDMPPLEVRKVPLDQLPARGDVVQYLLQERGRKVECVQVLEAPQPAGAK